MLSRDDFNLLDPEKKDEEWAKRMLYEFIFTRVPLTYGKNVVELRSWQNSTYNLEPFKIPYRHLLGESEGGLLKDHEAKDNLKIDFTRLGLFELTKNILGGEIDKNKIHIDANCYDPTIIAKKEAEFDLLRNKKLIEEQINKTYNEVGIDSNYKVGNQGEFNSNIDQFESLGLNPENPEDVDFFSGTLYRHKLETYISQIINQVNSINELSEIQKLHINDIISLKCLAVQTYYNTSTGLPSTRYIYPENVYKCGYTTKNDWSDAQALMIEDTTTVGDFLKMVGTDGFTRKDYNDILQYAGMGGGTTNYANETYQGGIDFDCNKVTPVGYCSWSDFFRFNVRWGYIEWKTTDRGDNGRYFQKTKKAYYLLGLSLPQKLYQYGDLNVQAREGWNTEYSLFSIGVYHIKGLSMLEIALPYLKRIFSCWLKYQYFLERAKPSGYAFDINSLYRVANLMIGKNGTFSDVEELLAQFVKTPNLLYSNGDEESEMKIGGNGVPYQELKNGIDPSAVNFLQAIDWCKVQIMEETGLNNARIAQSPSPEEAYKKTQLVTDQSENATEYIGSAIANIYGRSAYRIFSIIQSVIKFDIFGIDQLRKIFGDQMIDTVKSMNAVHTEYVGITIQRFLRDREREEIRSITMQSVINKEIPGEIAVMVNNIDDYEKAAAVLSFYKEKTRKQNQQQQLMAIQANADAEKAKHGYKLEEINAEGAITLQKQKMIEDGLIKQTELLMQGKIDQQTQRLSTQPVLNENKSNLKKQEETHKAGLETTQKIVENSNQSDVNQTQE